MDNELMGGLAEILGIITDKYVMNDLKIPESVLTLKDEACGIAEKAAREQNADILREYARRLCEIRGVLRGERNK